MDHSHKSDTDNTDFQHMTTPLMNFCSMCDEASCLQFAFAVRTLASATHSYTGLARVFKEELLLLSHFSVKFPMSNTKTFVYGLRQCH